MVQLTCSPIYTATLTSGHPSCAANILENNPFINIIMIDPSPVATLLIRPVFPFPNGGRLRGGPLHTPYEGPILANQASRKLGVFDRKLEGTTPYFIVILTYIRNKEAISLKFSISQSIKLNRYQEDFPLS